MKSRAGSHHYGKEYERHHIDHQFTKVMMKCLRNKLSIIFKNECGVCGVDTSYVY